MTAKTIISNDVFFLGGQDAEMVAIRQLLEEHGLPFHDHTLSWGARLSSYRDELARLAPNQVPVFIELDCDIPYPEHAVLVDHHGQAAGEDKPTSIEQVAQRLGVSLSRHRQLVSENDKGHIPGMQAFGASDQEIEQIRALDRRAQGVTGEDERLAEESIRQHLEVIEDGAVLIRGLTDRTSPVLDQLFDAGYRHIFIITPSGGLEYSGTGEMVCHLAAIYEQKKQNDPTLEFWSGGALPKHGFWGTTTILPFYDEKRPKPQDYAQIRDEIIQILKRHVSSHLFLFPFRLEDTSEETNKDSVLKTIITALLKKDSTWQLEHFNPWKSAEDWTEYFYFHDFFRKAIFPERTEDALKELLADDQSVTIEEIISCNFCKDLKPDDRITYTIDKQPFTLQLVRVSLRIFETSIAVLCLELANRQYDQIEDILLINDFCRRIYPQFLTTAEGIDAAKNTFFCSAVETVVDGETYRDCLPFAHFFTDQRYGGRPRLKFAAYIEEILNAKEWLPAHHQIQPIIDDRMYTLCWYGSDYWSKELTKSVKAKDEDELVYQTHDKWYQYVFVDGRELSVTNLPMKRRMIAEATYPRWATSQPDKAGTLFGVTRYSLVCLSDRQPFSHNVLRNHLCRLYSQIAVILLAQRASLLKFSADISAISKDVECFVHKSTSKKADRTTKSFKKISEEVNRLHSQYIRFMNRLWFSVVTPQEQGIDLYDMAADVMDLKKQATEMKAEIKELYEFVDAQSEKITNRRLNTLNVLASIFLPATLLTGIWGMNVFFINNLFPESGNLFYTMKELFSTAVPVLPRFVASVFFFLLSGLVCYSFFTSLLSNFQGNDSEEDFSVDLLLKSVRRSFFSRRSLPFWLGIFLFLLLLLCGNTLSELFRG